jgi:hypothetical protein
MSYTFVVLSAFQKVRIRLRALKDARVNHLGVADLIVALIGPRPVPFSPTEDERHRRLQHRRTDIAKAEDLVADRQQKEEAHKKNWNPVLMWFFVAVLYFVEFCGGADVLRKAGVDGGAVLVYAAMLTTAIFVVATVCAKQPRNTVRFYACYCGFVLVGIFAAVVRYHELVAREDASAGESLALAGLMFAITVLPAWLAEVCIRLALAGRETARDLALTKRQLQKEQKEIQGAHADVEAINAKVVQYDHVAGLIHAEYRRHWEYERKRLDGGHPVQLARPDDEPDHAA